MKNRKNELIYFTETFSLTLIESLEAFLGDLGCCLKDVDYKFLGKEKELRLKKMNFDYNRIYTLLKHDIELTERDNKIINDFLIDVRFYYVYGFWNLDWV